ncbi:MAG TPA: PLP-dependent aminotransferase family protein [Azospirillum sp.]|nr:PLP-dependent aminotransferase family protein [Azospirillum sp.]
MTIWIPNLAGREGPRYRAIADALAEDVASGHLPAGTRLPTHRDLAYRLGVTVGTVTRAYAEAERRGLIGGEVGRGTFVQGRQPALTNNPLAWHRPPESSAINMTAVTPFQTGAEQAISQALMAIATSGMAEQLVTYAPHAGLASHRAAAAQWLARQHRVTASPDSILVTTGVQNGMAVALASVARAGDVVLTERLTNYGMRALATTLQLHLEGVALDEHGLMPDALDAACRRLAPKVLYTVPTLQNPTASVMPRARREEIVAICRRHGVTIVEDDIFGFLIKDATPIQTIAPDITIYLSGVSKSVAAGLRVGYMVAPPALVGRLEATIRALHYSSPPLPSEVVTRWILDGHADRMAELQRVESAARQAIARAVLPASAVCGHPAGLHLWLVLPEPWRHDEFVTETRRRGVVVIGSDTFAVARTGAPHAVRIGLCMPHTREEVARGIGILADTLASPAGAALSIV